MLKNKVKPSRTRAICGLGVSYGARVRRQSEVEHQILGEDVHVRLWLRLYENSKLIDLSWFMRCLNEPIARLANHEDHCTGRFWEGRFKSQALLDERAVLACMAYVDLNPIRAAIAKIPEQSDFTSVQQRILHPEDDSLRPFAAHSDDAVGIPFSLKDYLELVDWAGRAIKPGKKGYIPSGTPPLLTRLRMDAGPVLDYLSRTEKQPFGALGPVSLLRAFALSILSIHSF